MDSKLIESIIIIAVVAIMANLLFGYFRGGVKSLWMKLFYIHLPIPLIFHLRQNVFEVSWGWIPLFLVLSIGAQQIAVTLRKKYGPVPTLIFTQYYKQKETNG